MKSNFTKLLACLFVFTTLQLSAQDVVIEEVLYNPAPGITQKIALRNLSASPVDVSNWCLCNRPSYDQVNESGFNILSGNATALGPGEVLILELTGNGFNMKSTNGEIALYHRTCGGYNDEVNMEDFVRWGPLDGNTRETVAVAAGLWIEGQTVSPAAEGEILVFDGTSDGGGGTVSIPSDFTNTVNGVLPVTLLDFSVAEEGGRVIIKWVTAEEFNSECFKIERSFDGMRYEQITRIEAAGTTTETSYYVYEDMEIFGDRTVYYRLKQMDFDGSLFCSSVEVINRSAPVKQPIIISPNPIPSNECLNIKLGSLEDRVYENLQLVIYNTLGEVVAIKTEADPVASGEDTFIDFPNVAPGTYFLSIINGQEKIAHQKVLVY